MANKIIHKHSNVVTDGQAKLPTSSQLEYGELAINYADGVETISIRNSADEIIEFRSKEYIDGVLSDTKDKVDTLEIDFEEHEEVVATALTVLNKKIDEFDNTVGTAVNERIESLENAFQEHEEVAAEAINDLNERTEGVENSLNNVNKSLGGRIDSIEDIIENMGTAGGGSSFGGLLNIKDNNAVKSAQDSLTENKSLKTFIITDSEGNYPSPNINTIYLDDLAALRDLLYRGNDNALKYLLDTKEAYYNYLGAWYSQNISQQVKLPKFNLTTAKVGDLVTIIRYEFTADEFYSKYIDFSTISNDNTAFQAYKLSQGFNDKSDGEFIQHLISNGTIHSCPVNPQVDNSVSPVPLSVNGKVIFYTAQITPNTQTIFSGEFWTGNMVSPGIYSYVTSGRPEGVNDIFIGYVLPNGAQMLVSTTNPENTYFRNSINDSWRRVGVGKNTGGTGEVFNDYTNNTAHEDHGHAEGQNCHANSYNAHAEGYSTNAGWNAHSEGSETNASGRASHAEGSLTVASGENSHAEGVNTEASGNNSHTEGYGTIASGNGAHAEGNGDGTGINNTASGMGSHAEGRGTIAEGEGSHAEGNTTKANGYASHAEGEGTTADGYASHAEGEGTITINDNEHAEGRYNVSIENQIHSVGIGTPGNAKNAHTIFNDGRHYIYGIGGYNGTNVAKSLDLATVVNATNTIDVSPLFTNNGILNGVSLDKFSNSRLLYYGMEGDTSCPVTFHPVSNLSGNPHIGMLIADVIDITYNDGNLIRFNNYIPIKKYTVFVLNMGTYLQADGEPLVQEGYLFNNIKSIDVTSLFTPNETIVGITTDNLSKNILYYDDTVGDQDSSVKYYPRGTTDMGGFLVMDNMDDNFNIHRTISKVINGNGGVTCVSVASSTELNN